MTDQIKQDINALVDHSSAPSALPPVEPVGGYPARRGRSTYTAVQASGTGGSASGEYTEVPGSRTYHAPSQVVLPTAGFFFYEVLGISSIQFKSGADVLKFNLEQPDYIQEPSP